MKAESGIGRRRQSARKEGGAEYTARREALVRAAATVFQEKGYEATTLNDIAERLGADRASLYYYVGSKEELFQEVVRGVLDANFKEAKRIDDLEIPASEKLNLLIQRLMISYEENFPYPYVYLQEDMRRVGDNDSAWAKGMARQTRRLETLVRAMIEEGIGEGKFRADLNVDLAANALYGMLNWTHRWFKPGRALDGEQVAKSFTEIFLNGVKI